MNVSLVQTWPVLEAGFRHSPHLIVLLKNITAALRISKRKYWNLWTWIGPEVKAPKSNLLRDRAICTVGPWRKRAERCQWSRSISESERLALHLPNRSVGPRQAELIGIVFKISCHGAAPRPASSQTSKHQLLNKRPRSNECKWETV